VFAISTDQCAPFRPSFSTIDPTASYTWNGTSKDTYVNSANPTTSYGTGDHLKLGFDGTNTDRALIRFPVESQLAGGVLCPTTCDVDSATLSLWEDVANACDADLKPFSVYRNTAAFSDTTTWNTKPSYNATSRAQLQANAGNVNHTASPGGCSSGSSYSKSTNWVPNANGTGSYVTSDLTNLVEDWTTGAAENHGITVRADDEAAKNQWKTFISTEGATGNPSNAPKLDVTYSYPEAPSSLSVDQSDLPAVMHATFSDPDSDSGHVSFTVTDPDGDVIVDGAAGSTVASGSDSTLTLDTSLYDFQTGDLYTWTAVSSDGVAESTATSQQSFAYTAHIGGTPTPHGVAQVLHHDCSDWASHSVTDNHSHTFTYQYRVCVEDDLMDSGNYQLAGRAKIRGTSGTSYVTSVTQWARLKGCSSGQTDSSCTNATNGTSNVFTGGGVDNRMRVTTDTIANYNLGDHDSCTTNGRWKVVFNDGKTVNPDIDWTEGSGGIDNIIC
jgi:hypothetical protein